MKLLYLSLDPPLDPSRVATGNQVRVQGLREALERHGHEVTQAIPSEEAKPTDPESPGLLVYRTREELAEFVRDGGYGALVVGYWSLLDHLKAVDAPPPVVLDVIAPRLLEALFQDPDHLAERTAEFLALLPRADHFLVGNQRQADLLLPLLLQAGFDCREDVPVSIVPISTRSPAAHRDRAPGPPRVVNAGVNWPWRQSEDYAAVLHEAVTAGEAEFLELKGDYPGDGDEASTLKSYGDMQQVLLDCDIGMELGARNTERAFSHSFRALEYLECGLALVVNPWIPLADAVREHDAGWVVSSPEELREVLAACHAAPELLAAKRRGARALAGHDLNYAVTTAPLRRWLEQPVRAPRLAAPQPAPRAAADRTEAPALRDFVESPTPKPSTFKVLLGSLFKILFCPPRPDSTPDVLMVTRSDLFPTDHGAAVKIVRTAEALSRQGRDVWLATDDRREYHRFHAGERSVHRYPWWLRLFALPRVVAFSRLILKGYPVSNSFLYLPVTDGSYIARALWLASRKPVGAYLSEFPAYVRPLRFARSLFGGKLLLVQHNVEYERIRGQVPELTEKNFRTLKQLELAMCALADAIVAVSDNDRFKMIEDGVEARKVHTIPHGVDLQSFRDTPVIDVRERFDIPRGDRLLVYHGTYSYPPNLEAMQVMAGELLPRLARRGVEVSVLAIGSHAPDFPLHEKVRFVGSILDLAEVLPAADLAVVPLQDGGGTRMKILDYFAAGVPVISTSKGIEGIPVTSGREALVIDDFDGMADAVERLLANPDEAAALSGAASAFVDTLGWDAIARRYLPLMK